MQKCLMNGTENSVLKHKKAGGALRRLFIAFLSPAAVLKNEMSNKNNNWE